MAHILHLAWGRVRERDRKGRKLPGKVLQCFKNLSSHSAELSCMNNRFGTWPACIGDSVTAALWSGFPTFDGCAVSQNSWRRGAPAECMRWRGKKKNKQKAKEEISLWGRHTHLGSAGTRRVTLWHGLWHPTLRQTDISAPQAPLVPKWGPGRRCTMCNATPDGGPASAPSWWGSAVCPPPPAAPKGIFPARDHLLRPLQAWACCSGTDSLEEWVGGTASPSLGASLSAHQRAIVLPQGWLNAPGATFHSTLRCLYWFWVNLWL